MWRFSLATLLLCTAIVATTAFACKTIPARDYKRVPGMTDHVRIYYTWEAFNRPPTTSEFALRVAWSGPLAIAPTLVTLRAVRWASNLG
jgi:hypothetical protein